MRLMKWFKLIKNILVVTGSRADYGLLKRLMKLIDSDPEMKLQIIVTGSHLSSKHGLTYKEIEEDGFQIGFKVDIIENVIDAQSTARAMSKAQNEITKILSEVKPDLMLVLGDRYEILSAVISALLSGVPVAHIHGGEVTTGAFDDAIRNAITKMSHLHFTATEISKNRVIQMGEIPSNTFNFGGLGVDALQSFNFLSQEEVEKKLEKKFGEKNLLVTYHPETISKKSASEQIQILLDALSVKKDINLIFTGVNADPGSGEIARAINQFVQSNSNAKYYPSLGQSLYLSTLLYCDGVVGNSSSGILEVPALKKATINIGNRQLGREMAESVFNCELDSGSIAKSIDEIYSENFKVILSKVSNPYGRGGASLKIFEEIKKSDLSNLVVKSFHDL
jgi:GDP/UDP-N,N'-diacetylbacillosamine 2-epimerase (hydrolysing)